MTDTLIDGVDYGPIAVLAGCWQGNSGMDVSPEPDGEERSAYSESLMFEPIGDVKNAGQQTLALLRYHQIVTRQSDNQVFHNETGYLMWDATGQVVMQTLAIPRGVSLVAGGTAQTNETGMVLRVTAEADSDDWTIAQSPFMRDNARTVAFSHTITVDGDVLTYEETTVVDIYGKRFDHTDGNRLSRTSGG